MKLTNPQPKGNSLKNNMKIVRNDGLQAQEALKQLRSDLTALVEISKKRRPSEIRKSVESIVNNSFYLAETHLKDQKFWIDKLEAEITNLANNPPAPVAATPEELRQAYALVQAIPATVNAPNGKEESTIRAIMAILKVHHGIDPLGSIADAQMPDLPIVLVHEVEKVS
jgi:hypothetical protein